MCIGTNTLIPGEETIEGLGKLLKLMIPYRIYKNKNFTRI